MNRKVYLFTWFNNNSCSNTSFMTDSMPTNIKQHGKWIELAQCNNLISIEEAERFIINSIQPFNNVLFNNHNKPLRLYFIANLKPIYLYYTITPFITIPNHRYILDNVLAFSFDDAKNKLLFYLAERHSKNSEFRIMMDCCFYLEYLGKFNNYIDTVLFLLIHYLLRNHFNPESIDYIYKNYEYINKNYNTPDFIHFFEFNLY